MKNDVSSVLWDIKKEKQATLPQDFVTKRILAYGTITLIIQTIKKFGISSVRNSFNSLKPTAIPKKKYLYLKNYLIR